jgi:hypothetical protein
MEVASCLKKEIRIRKRGIKSVRGHCVKSERKRRGQ